MFDSFVKATKAFFVDVKIEEFKALTVKDKTELSEMLNAIPGYEHPQYVPKAA